MSVLNKNYPTSMGNRRQTVARITGPGSYTQYVAPSTGGVTFTAFPYGVKDVDWAIGMVSDSGLYRAEVVQIESAQVQGRTLGRAGIVLKIYVVATGAEVAALFDLDAETFSVLIQGGQ